MSVEEEILADVNNAAAQTEVSSEPAAVVSDSEETIEEPTKEDFYKSQYENLQKDYTRKAQELAELKKINIDEPKVEEPEWTKPDYQPKTWQEVFEKAKQATLKEVEPALNEYQQSRQQREAYSQAQAVAEAEMTEIKGLNPKVDENQIYQHATKYGFSNLKAAYQNLIDMQGIEKTAQAKVLKNLKIRESDPVGVSGATEPDDYTPTYQSIVGQKSIYSAAQAALRSLKGK